MTVGFVSVQWREIYTWKIKTHRQEIKWTYSWTIRWLRLGWRGLIADDLRDKPTRDVCNDGMIILLVGKPIGALDFFFGGSDVGTKMMREINK